jgi:hypothetical protein
VGAASVVLSFDLDSALVGGPGPVRPCVDREIYRLDRAWRLRAPDRGYDDGLAGLARDFGIDVA